MLEKRNKQLTISTCLLVAVLQLQVFRRLSLVGYIGVLLIAYIFWFKSVPFSSKVKIKMNGICFLACYLFMPILSLLTMQPSEYITAFIRYSAIMPFLVISFLYSEIIYYNINNLIKIYILVVVASAFFMVYQVPFGRVSFFADDTAGRLGYERYGSLMGSTTTYGTASLAAIMCLHNYKPFKTWINIACEVLIIIGGILCLSKAFFINIAIAYALMIIFGTGNKGKRSINSIFNKIIGVTFTILVILGVLYIVIRKTFVGNYFRDMFRYTFQNGSLGVNATLNNRLTTRPAAAFAFHGLPYIYYLFLGVGFIGYSGVLGLTQYPMCHNNYFDILLAQGLPALLSLLSIYIFSFLRIHKGKDPDSCLVKQLVPYILINMFAGQWMYLTVSASLFLCIIFSVYNNRGRLIEYDKDFSVYSYMEASR